jgi:hypothetical protein
MILKSYETTYGYGNDVYQQVSKFSIQHIADEFRRENAATVHHFLNLKFSTLLNFIFGAIALSYCLCVCTLLVYLFSVMLAHNQYNHLCQL